MAYAFFYAGRALVATRPCRGLPGNGPLIEVWILAPLTTAVLAVCATVLIAVELAVAEGAAAAQKEITGTISIALAAFLSSSLVAWTEDQDASRIADKIRDAFWAKYKRPSAGGERKNGVCYLAAGSAAERLLYSNLYRGSQAGAFPRVGNASEPWSKRSARRVLRFLTLPMTVAVSLPCSPPTGTSTLM